MIRRFVEIGQRTSEISSNIKLSHLSFETNNRRITQEMNGLLDNVNVQIQRAISEAINEQVLPQLQASLRFLNGQSGIQKLNMPFERLERNPENTFNCNVRCTSTDELPQCSNFDDDRDQAHYTT